MDPDARKHLLILATLKCLKKYGFQGTSIRRICEEADVSVGLINHHYKGKDELVVETFTYLSRTYLDLLKDAVRLAGEGGRQRLSGLFNVSFGRNILKPTLLESWVAFWGAVHSEASMSRAYDAWYLEFRGLLADGLMRLAKENRWDGFNAHLAAISLSALLDGLWLEYCLNPKTFTPSQGVQMCEAWVDGLLHHGYQRFCHAATA